MKTSRWFRIFMMALDTVVLFFLRIFRRFDKVYRYEALEQTGPEDKPHPVKGTPVPLL